MEKERYADEHLVKGRRFVGVVEGNAGIGIGYGSMVDEIRLIFGMLGIRGKVNLGFHGRMGVFNHGVLHPFLLSVVPIDV